MAQSVKWIVWSLIFSVTLASAPTALAASANGQGLFEKRCAACHKLPDPGQPPAQGWSEQLNLMAPLARLKKEQKQAVLDYLMSHSQEAAMLASLDEDRELFEEKCARCHTTARILLSPLEGESLRHVVNRMQSRSGTDWLSDQDVEQVLAYLEKVSREARRPDSLNGDSTASEIFATRCSECHTLERVFKKVGDDANPSEFWSHTVSRMRGKAPQWLSESEADEILRYLQSASAAQY